MEIRKSRRRKLRLWSINDWVSWITLFLIVVAVASLLLPLKQLYNTAVISRQKFDALAQDVEPIVEIKTIAERAKIKDGSAPRVLWVDDNPDNNVHERDALSKAGLEFTLAKSTPEARRILNGNTFALIISDFNRDGEAEAGFRLFDYVKTLRDAPPFIIYSSSASFSRSEAKRRGVLVGDVDGPYDLFRLVVTALNSSKAI